MISLHGDGTDDVIMMSEVEILGRTSYFNVNYYLLCRGNSSDCVTYIMLFSWKLDTHPMLHNANNVGPYSFLSALIRIPPLCYVTLESPLSVVLAYLDLVNFYSIVCPHPEIRFGAYAIPAETAGNGKDNV